MIKKIEVGMAIIVAIITVIVSLDTLVNWMHVLVAKSDSILVAGVCIILCVVLCQLLSEGAVAFVSLFNKKEE